MIVINKEKMTKSDNARRLLKNGNETSETHWNNALKIGHHKKTCQHNFFYLEYVVRLFYKRRFLSNKLK